MAALRQPFGFKPSRSLSGNFNPATRRYPVQLNGTYARHPIFAGSPVVAVTAAVGVMQMTAVASAAEPKPVGIVAQVLDSNQRPLTFNQPTKGPMIEASAAGYVDVYIDPDNVYWVATDTTVAGTNINACVGVTALSSAHANNTVGRCPFGVTLGTDTSATVSRPFRILGPSPQTRDYLTNADWIDGVEVVLALNQIQGV